MVMAMLIRALQTQTRQGVMRRRVELVAVSRERNGQDSGNIQEVGMVEFGDRCPQGGVWMR